VGGIPEIAGVVQKSAKEGVQRDYYTEKAAQPISENHVETGRVAQGEKKKT